MRSPFPGMNPYEKGRYHLAIDYTQPPQPPLSEADSQWAETYLRMPDA